MKIGGDMSLIDPNKAYRGPQFEEQDPYVRRELDISKDITGENMAFGATKPPPGDHRKIIPASDTGNIQEEIHLRTIMDAVDANLQPKKSEGLLAPATALAQYKAENYFARRMRDTFLKRPPESEKALEEADPQEVYKTRNPVLCHIQKALYEKNPSWASKKYQEAFQDKEPVVMQDSLTENSSFRGNSPASSSGSPSSVGKNSFTKTEPHSQEIPRRGNQSQTLVAPEKPLVEKQRRLSGSTQEASELPLLVYKHSEQELQAIADKQTKEQKNSQRKTPPPDQ